MARTYVAASREVAGNTAEAEGLGEVCPPFPSIQERDMWVKTGKQFDEAIDGLGDVIIQRKGWGSIEGFGLI